MTQGAAGGPIIVVGAGRSGTTMIRDALSKHPAVTAIPYEINYLWRYGNAELPHDCLVPEEHLTTEIGRYIGERLQALCSGSSGTRLLDKTVANVVRLRYVKAILPDAYVVHIIRDGRAVAASAMKRWKASQPPQYYLAKARLIPARDIPRYGFRYVKNLLRSKLLGQDHRQTWGVRFPGIDEMVAGKSLSRVCAAQWRYSVETALQEAVSLKEGTYMEIRYESLVDAPIEAFKEIQRFLDLSDAPEVEQWVGERVDATRRDQWKNTLSSAEMEEIMAEAGRLLRELGYA